MDLDPIIRSLRRSALRRRALRCMQKRKRAFPALLAEDLDISPRDLRRVLHGKLPHYAPELSPIPLGLIERVQRGRRVELAITPLGSRVVAQMRRHVGRREAGLE